ncbi:helix-turn-helix domain-containing protein [Enterococcus casseliflavus]|nr:helix-turn-helix domain-containing protein [Enterococcus casseliflavus]
MLDLEKNIKELRQSKKMTQKSLARILNVTPQAVSKWERNESNPDIQTLISLSNYFNVSVDEILGRKRPTFFETLFSKMKGYQNMEKTGDLIKTKDSEEEKKWKKVVIFDIVFSFIADQGLLQTQALSRKLEMLMQKRGHKVLIETYNSNQVNQYGGEADLILLTPSFGYAKNEIEQNFPTTPVIAISKKDYGMLNVEKLYKEIENAFDR